MAVARPVEARSRRGMWLQVRDPIRHAPTRQVLGPMLAGPADIGSAMVGRSARGVAPPVGGARSRNQP